MLAGSQVAIIRRAEFAEKGFHLSRLGLKLAEVKHFCVCTELDVHVDSSMKSLNASKGTRKHIGTRKG